MNEHDQDIDQTLSALRGVEVPSGLEQRVLQLLDVKLLDSENRLRGRHAAWIFPASPRRRLTLVTACAALGVVAATALLHSPQRIPPAAEPVAGSAARPTAQPVGMVSPSRPLQSPTSRRATTHRVRLDVPVHARPPYKAVASTSPAQLTEQERLLQQIARSHDPVQFAMLNPDVLARKEQDGDAEFRQFFASQPVQIP